MSTSKIFVKTSTSNWKTSNRMYVKTSTSTWKPVKKVWAKINPSTWKLVFTSGASISKRVEIEQTTSFPDYVITLIGYNYYWEDYNSSMYLFQHSLDGVTWNDLNVLSTILNPTPGNYTSKQHVVSFLTPDSENFYRFLVTTTTDTGDEATSESLTTSIQAPRNINNLSYTSRSATSVSLSWSPSQYSNSQILQYRVAPSTGYVCPPGYGTAYQDGSQWYCQNVNVPYNIIAATPPTSGTGWSNYSTYSSSVSSATVAGLAQSTKYDFRIIPYTGLNGAGYAGNTSNVLTVTTETSQYYCNPKYNLNCGNLIYTSQTEPTIVSQEGSPCWVSGPLTQYKYYINKESYTCDASPYVVSGPSASCPGCSAYEGDTSYYSCNGTSINTDASGTGCQGCGVSTDIYYMCYSRLTTCPQTTYSCSPKVTTTCTNGPFTSTNANAYPTYCSRTSSTTYSCPSGYTGPYLCVGGGGTRCCDRTSGGFTSTVGATATTTYTFYLNENTTTCNGTTKATDANGTGCLGCSVSQSTSNVDCYKCDGSGYAVSGFSASCPGCSVQSVTSRTCSPKYNASTSWLCKSRLSYTCTDGPYWSDTNPASYSCGNIDLVTSYNYKKYTSEYSCNNTTRYYTSNPNDPECKDCQVYQV